jgi:hypothetical protein
VTLREIPAEEARAWIANSLGLPPGGDLLERFDPGLLPTHPTVFESN